MVVARGCRWSLTVGVMGKFHEQNAQSCIVSCQRVCTSCASCPRLGGSVCVAGRLCLRVREMVQVCTPTAQIDGNTYACTNAYTHHTHAHTHAFTMIVLIQVGGPLPRLGRPFAGQSHHLLGDSPSHIRHAQEVGQDVSFDRYSSPSSRSGGVVARRPITSNECPKNCTPFGPNCDCFFVIGS